MKSQSYEIFYTFIIALNERSLVLIVEMERELQIVQMETGEQAMLYIFF